MHLFFLILVIILQSQVFTIDQKCSQSPSLCPTQAICNNNYCVCNSGYIGNCNIQAQVLSSSQISASLNGTQTIFFSVNPQELNHYIQYTFTICQNVPNLLLTFTIWQDNGIITNFNSMDAQVLPTQYIMNAGCNQLITSSISLGSQPNGNNDLLILGIQDNGVSTSIEISVSQKKVMALALYTYILIVIVAFIAISIIVAAVTFLLRRRIRYRESTSSTTSTVARPSPVYNNIDHFDTFMPLFPADKLGGQQSNCAICIQEITKAQVVRRTPCKHIFHSSCLDAWCLKNMSCPVCRRDFSYQILNAPRRSRTTKILANPKFETSWQQQEQEDSNAYPIQLQLQQQS